MVRFLHVSGRDGSSELLTTVGRLGIVLVMERSQPGLGARLAAELTSERAYRRMTWPELAKRSGISERALHRYLNGERPINSEDLESISLALGVPVDEMFLRAVTGEVHRVTSVDETEPRRNSG